nr:hypothetical chloroplast RF88 [Navicula sp.]WPV72707.1 hypothetical chloroplast RF88 [Navicula sp.]
MKQEKDLFNFTLRELYEFEPEKLDELGINSFSRFISYFGLTKDIEKVTTEQLWEKRCICKEQVKNQNLFKGRDPKSLPYLDKNESTVKTFQLRYEKKLSSIAKLILNSFQNKYIYYAIDDILYSFQSNPSERENLLAILYSPILSLHNNFSISLFDIWIDEIYINKISKVNKFLNNDVSNLEQCSYITIKLSYKTRMPVKKLDSLW